MTLEVTIVFVSEDMATEAKPLGVKVHQAAQDVQMDLVTMDNKVRLMLRNLGDQSAMLALIADVQGVLKSAEMHNRTVLENTGRGKSDAA